MADNNSNTATVAQLLHSGEEEDGYGDIEQGRNIIMSEHTDGLRSSSSSWAAAAITGGKSANTTSTTTTKLPLPLGGIEHADVEDTDAAPVPLIQQIDDTELEEDNVAPIEDFSTTLQLHPPTQEAMLEQIEDDDDAAPRPFTDFERESRLKIDLENISTDEEDGPPLPLTYQQDSLSDAEEKVVTSQVSASNISPNESSAAASIYGNESIGVDPILQQMDERESPRDEENLQQQFSASEEEDAHQGVPTPMRNPSWPILEAYLVEEEEEEIDDTLAHAAGSTVPVVTPDIHDTVYEATPLEPELPWWKQRRNKAMLAIFCVLITALAAGLGVTLSRLVVPAAADKVTASPSMSLSPSHSPTERYHVCFADSKELKSAIDRYVQLGCNEGAAFCPASIVEKYGWPMGSWCVDDVTDMASLFEGLDTFDEDISGWNVGQVTAMNRMFWGASSFNHNLSSWNISSVSSTREMFKGASSFNQNLCAWGDNFPYSNANGIFEDSGCTFRATHHQHIKAHFVLPIATWYLLLTASRPVMSSRLQLINTFKDPGVLLTVQSMDGRLDLGVWVT
eukprot:scaffold625_cov169-Skeletonema_dohrnii-CCMP3373.AAC.9